MKTREEVEKLKHDWNIDACWDLSETDGFEEYKEELLAHEDRMYAHWEKQKQHRELELKRKAEELGVVGLYKLLLEKDKEVKELQEEILNLTWDIEKIKNKI